MSENVKIFQRIKYMDNVLINMRTIKEFLLDDLNDIIMKNLIDEVNQTINKNIKEVLDFAKERGVYVRENRESAASEIFRRQFDFWINDAHRLTSKDYSRSDFGSRIAEGLYSLRYFRNISKPTKAGVVKCPDRIAMELADYPVITKFKDGDFKIQGDKELFDFLAEIEEFYALLEKWKNKK